MCGVHFIQGCGLRDGRAAAVRGGAAGDMGWGSAAAGVAAAGAGCAWGAGQDVPGGHGAAAGGVGWTGSGAGGGGGAWTQGAVLPAADGVLGAGGGVAGERFRDSRTERLSDLGTWGLVCG